MWPGPKTVNLDKQAVNSQFFGDKINQVNPMLLCKQTRIIEMIKTVSTTQISQVKTGAASSLSGPWWSEPSVQWSTGSPSRQNQSLLQGYSGSTRERVRTGQWSRVKPWTLKRPLDTESSSMFIMFEMLPWDIGWTSRRNVPRIPSRSERERKKSGKNTSRIPCDIIFITINPLLQ